MYYFIGMRHHFCFCNSIFTPANIFLELFHHSLSSLSSSSSSSSSYSSLYTFPFGQTNPFSLFQTIHLSNPVPLSLPPPRSCKKQNTILQSLISATTNSTAPSDSSPSYKFAVTSTIIQHIPSEAGAEVKEAGRRGMHSATGAFWNNEKDGMWSYKYEKGQARGDGFDVIVSVVWVSLL